MYHHDHETILEQCRAMINAHQFNNEPFRLLLVALGSGLRATETLIAPNFQKHVYREMKMTDAIVHGKEIKWNPTRGRYVLLDDKEDKDDDGEGEGEGESQPSSSKKTAETKTKTRIPMHKTPTKPNPFHLSFYGMLCTSAKSYQSGLCKRFFHL